MPSDSTLARERFDAIVSQSRSLVTVAATVAAGRLDAELDDVVLDGFVDELEDLLERNAGALVGAPIDYLAAVVRSAAFGPVADDPDRVAAATGPELLELARLAVDELQAVVELKARRDALERDLRDAASTIVRSAVAAGLSAAMAL